MEMENQDYRELNTRQQPLPGQLTLYLNGTIQFVRRRCLDRGRLSASTIMGGRHTERCAEPSHKGRQPTPP